VAIKRGDGGWFRGGQSKKARRVDLSSLPQFSLWQIAFFLPQRAIVTKWSHAGSN
jgi:hypothetical protein